MVGVWMVALASASMGSMVDEEPSWGLAGPVACDAVVVLREAMHDDSLTLEEARRVAQCDHTSAWMLDVMPAFMALREAVVAHGDDPDALVDLASAVSTMRSGILGDAVRLALQLEIAGSLEGLRPGPWQHRLRVVAAAEPGVRPADDPPVFRRMLWGGLRGGRPDDVSRWEWGRGGVMAAGYLAASPWYAAMAEDAQLAVDGPTPEADLAAVRGRWGSRWPMDGGLVTVTLDLLDDEERLRSRWNVVLDGV